MLAVVASRRNRREVRYTFPNYYEENTATKVVFLDEIPPNEEDMSEETRAVLIIQLYLLGTGDQLRTKLFEEFPFLFWSTNELETRNEIRKMVRCNEERIRLCVRERQPLLAREKSKTAVKGPWMKEDDPPVVHWKMDSKNIDLALLR